MRNDTPAGQPRVLLTATEVAEILAVDRAVVYRLVIEGHLPFIRVGSRPRFDADDVRAFVDRCRELIVPTDHHVGDRRSAEVPVGGGE